MAWYTGQTFRGVDYNPTWPGWNQGPGANDVNQRLQTFDSDMANDAFAALWGKGYQASPAGNSPFSVPFDNGTNYRDDLGTIASEGFNLVRLYNWDVARGTSPSQQLAGLDHVNFLTYAQSLGLKVVVPVSDYFLNNDQFSWNGVTPDASYSFGSATSDIQNDFKQFIASITDPSTGKIFSNVLISVGNEGDIGEGGIFQANNSPPNTNASDFLARTIWWVHNLHEQINGTGPTGPDGLPVANGASGAIVPISATFANADQGNNGVNGSWMNWVLTGATAGQASPNGWQPNGQTFTTAVTGLAAVDPEFASYYFNSFNIGQSTTVAPFGNGIAHTLELYDNATSPWPGVNVRVPLMLMEVFNPNRDQYPTPADQALAAVNEAKAIEAYLALHNAGTARSTTNLMGYNYFEFNDEPAANKQVGLFQYDTTSVTAHTGTSGIFYISRGGFADFTFPVYKLIPTPGPGGVGTLAGAWTATFPDALNAHNDAYVVLQDSPLALSAAKGVLGNDVSESDAAVALQAGVVNGLLELGTDGALAYTPGAGFSGIDTFSYYSLGEYGAIESGQATIHVVPVNVGATTTLNLPALTAEEQIATLYAGFYGRAVDGPGLAYWRAQLDRNMTLDDIAGPFVISDEATARYGFLANPAGASDAQMFSFVDSVYNSLFNRSSDAAGASYWTAQIKQTLLAGQSVGSAVVDIIGGAQETAAYKDITTLMSKVAVSLEYAEQQEFHGVAWAGASDIAATTALLHGVTADPHSLLVGMKTAELLIINHA